MISASDTMPPQRRSISATRWGNEIAFAESGGEDFWHGPERELSQRTNPACIGPGDSQQELRG